MKKNQECHLKAIMFEKPDYIPMRFSINGACWHHYPQDRLFDLMEEHKFLFPDFKRPKGIYKPVHSLVQRKDEPYTDVFGCIWTTMDDGITGIVTKHPLQSWDNFTTWKVPDPSKSNGLFPVDWNEIEKNVSKRKKAGEFVGAGLRHGHTFLQLCDIRGYENLLFDMIDEEKRLFELIDIVEQFNLYIVEKYINIGVDEFDYGEDLGVQVGPMIPRDMFLKYIKPSYKRLMKPAIDKNVIVHMHSDGDIKELADDLVDSGVQVINLQDLVNGIDWIASKYRGKICVDLDIDRQTITPYGTPKQIDDLIREEVSKISTPDGGLTMMYGLYPGVPLENIKALMDAMEKYAFFYS